MTACETVTVDGVTAEVARSLAARMKGLIGRRGLPPGRGLLILRCNAIHTLFMRFPIDAVFYDRHGRAVKTVRNIRPWRFFIWGGFRAVKVLETEARRSTVSIGGLVSCGSGVPCEQEEYHAHEREAGDRA